jgi:invasion protein IalB
MMQIVSFKSSWRIGLQLPIILFAGLEASLSPVNHAAAHFLSSDEIRPAKSQAIEALTIASAADEWFRLLSPKPLGFAVPAEEVRSSEYPPLSPESPNAAEALKEASAENSQVLLLSPASLGSATPAEEVRPSNQQSRIAQAQDIPPPPASGGQAPFDAQPIGIVEKHGEWTLKCLQAPKVQCELGQRTLNASNSESLLWIEISRDRSQKLGSLTVATPLGVDITTGLRVLVDNDEVMRTKFLGCIAVGCLSQPALTQRFLDQLSQASVIRVSVVSADGRSATLPMSANGFAEGYIRMANYLRQGK